MAFQDPTEANDSSFGDMRTTGPVKLVNVGSVEGAYGKPTVFSMLCLDATVKASIHGVQNPPKLYRVRGRLAVKEQHEIPRRSWPRMGPEIQQADEARHYRLP